MAPRDGKGGASRSAPVPLGRAGTDTPLAWGPAAGLLEASASTKGDPAPILELLAASHDAPPTPGHGQTVQLWEFLASLAAADLVAARTVEPHLDAAAILSQAGMAWEPGTTWGVFAAEGGPGLVASAPGDPSGPWMLDGQKPWCSLAGVLGRAVVTAHVPGGRRAFAVDLEHPGVTAQAGGWASHGLHRVPSEPVHFAHVPAYPVGATQWYLDRPGFAVGGVGVAACWFGGAAGIFRTLRAAARSREPDQLALAWLGETDRLLAAGAAMLKDAARSADAGTLGAVGAQRVRGQVAGMCERIISVAGRALGPGPLCLEEDHARRVADLGIYIRQHHAARDDAQLGRLLLQEPESSTGGFGPW